LYKPFSDCFRDYLWQRAEVAGQHPVIHAFFTNLIQQEVLPDTLCTEEEVKKWGVDLGLSDEVATLVAKLARDDDYTFEHFHADYATQVLGTSGVWVDESVIMFVQHVLQDLGITLTIHHTPEYRTTRCEQRSRTVNLLLKDNHYQALS
jgi:hypothetical protein